MFHSIDHTLNDLGVGIVLAFNAIKHGICEVVGHTLFRIDHISGICSKHIIEVGCLFPCVISI